MNTKTFLMLLTGLLFQFSCNNKSSTNLSSVGFIPKPAVVNASGESFELKPSTIIYFEEGVEGLQQNAEYLAMEINRIAGNTPAIKPADELPFDGIFLASPDENEHLGEEEYNITIGEEIIGIKAAASAGIFYAKKTLLQTIPANYTTEYVKIPTGTIHDFPEYAYRGVMLDVSRHFFEVMDEMEYMVFPRLPGYAEIGWTAPEIRNWEEYKNRLAKHGKRFEAMDIDFYRSDLVPWEN